MTNSPMMLRIISIAAVDSDFELQRPTLQPLAVVACLCEPVRTPACTCPMTSRVPRRSRRIPLAL